MKRKLLNTAVAAVIGIMISGSVYAGNTPNSARTLTSGIGSGTSHGRIPSSHPMSTRSSFSSRSSSASGDFLSRYRSGVSNRPSASSSSSHSGGRPATFPGAGRLPTQAATQASDAHAGISSSWPISGSSNPGSSSSAGIPSSVSTGIPSSVSTGIPSSVSAGIPSSVSAGIPASVSIPAPPSLPAGNFPGAASAGLDTATSSGAAAVGFSAANAGLSRRP